MQTMYDTYSSRDVVRIAGISYRQLDYWARIGLVPEPLPRIQTGAPAWTRQPRTSRRWTTEDLFSVATLAEARKMVSIDGLQAAADRLFAMEVGEWRSAVECDSLLVIASDLAVVINRVDLETFCRAKGAFVVVPLGAVVQDVTLGLRVAA